MPSISETLALHDLAIFTLDRELRFTAFNRAHADNMRAAYGAEVAIGGRFADYITVTTGPRDDSGRPHAGARRRASRHKCEPRRAGREHHFEVVYEPVMTSAGEVVGVAGHESDVTEQRSVETNLFAKRATLPTALRCLSRRRRCDRLGQPAALAAANGMRPDVPLRIAGMAWSVFLPRPSWPILPGLRRKDHASPAER